MSRDDEGGCTARNGNISIYSAVSLPWYHSVSVASIFSVDARYQDSMCLSNETFGQGVVSNRNYSGDIVDGFGVLNDFTSRSRCECVIRGG